MNFVESKRVEWKREYTDNIKFTVVAFANTEGGKLYIGVNDDGGVCGVADVDGTLLRLTSMIRAAIRPDVTLFTDCHVEEIEGKQVVALEVQRGTSRPYYLYAKGVRPEGVYVRQGASSVPASETAILQMIRETSGDCYEDARSLNQRLTFEKAATWFSKRNVEFGDAQKHTLHLIGQDGTYSNLGMLLSDQCLHTIKLAVFEGDKKSVFKDRKELAGSLLEQLEGAYTYIDQFNHIHASFEGLERIDQRDYPAEALREALLNAIVHRDYSVSGSTLISIFEDRIEFVTIGGLVSGISYDDIMLGVSALRNPYLANIFYRLRLIEAYGTGIMKIKESYADQAIRPKIEIGSNAFKITLPNINHSGSQPIKEASAINYPTSMLSEKERRQIVLNLLASQRIIIRRDVQNLLGVSQSTAGLLLRKMVENHLLTTEGKGRNLRYQLSGKIRHIGSE